MKYLPVALPVIAASALQAQDVSVTVNRSRVVQVGDPFPAAVRVNAGADSAGLPEKNAFRALQNKGGASGIRVDIRPGGMVSRSTDAAFGYMVQPGREGAQEVAPAEAAVDGKTFRSEPAAIQAADSGSKRPSVETLADFREASRTQDVLVTVDFPRMVQVGDPFLATVRVNADAVNIKLPEMRAFKVLRDCGRTSGSRISINGRGEAVRSADVTSGYIMQADKEGTQEIAPVEVTVDRKTFRSEPVTVQTVPASRNVSADK